MPEPGTGTVTEEKPEGVVEPVVETPAAETDVSHETPPEVVDDGGEPGGKSPLEVARRKEYERRLAAEKTAQEEREARIRLEEQMRLIKESQKTPEKPVTVDDVSAAITSGEITQARGLELIATIAARREREEAEQQLAARRPIEKAEKAITEYQEYVTWIDNQSDPNYLAAKREYDRLVNDFGYPRNLVTSLAAVEKVAGPIDKLKARKQMNENTRQAAPFHTESPAGGNSGGPAASSAISKVPKALIESWRNSGASEDQVKKYAEHHLAKMERRRASMGG